MILKKTKLSRCITTTSLPIYIQVLTTIINNICNVRFTFLSYFIICTIKLIIQISRSFCFNPYTSPFIYNKRGSRQTINTSINLNTLIWLPNTFLSWSYNWLTSFLTHIISNTTYLLICKLLTFIVKKVTLICAILTSIAIISVRTISRLYIY